jgi:predicted NAD/FAD-binding protein
MKIAIVGAGVSGLVAAHLLHGRHEIVVYEAGGYAGGHTNTIRVDTEYETHHIDTGFIVMNDRNYPLFTRLLDRLGVARQPTQMSFSVKGESEDFEYSGTPHGLFCQPRNLVSLRFQRMILDLVRFNRELRRLLEGGATGEADSLADFLARHRFSRQFVERLIVPQASAVWSADPAQMHSFPVRFLAEFFANHGMLGFRDRPRWSTIEGGSARYVEALTTPFRDRIRLGAPVRSIAREPGHVTVVAEGRGGRDSQRFDHVVIAAHSDQALTVLSDPSERERRVLGAIPYQHNEAVLHTDRRLLPRRRWARSAWNFHLLAEPKPVSTVTYWMNHLQRLRADRDFCVTLNRTEAIAPEKVIRTISYSHPVFTPAGVAAQSQRAEISGIERRTHYCGAYWGWGFHEDGVRSALAACAPFGATL